MNICVFRLCCALETRNWSKLSNGLSHSTLHTRTINRKNRNVNQGYDRLHWTRNAKSRYDSYIGEFIFLYTKSVRVFSSEELDTSFTCCVNDRVYADTNRPHVVTSSAFFFVLDSEQCFLRLHIVDAFVVFLSFFSSRFFCKYIVCICLFHWSFMSLCSFVHFASPLVKFTMCDNSVSQPQ